MIGRDTAQRIIEQYGTNDLKTIVDGETLEVRTKHPWRASYRDAYIHPIIFVPRDQPRAEFRTSVAHCLGHHFMHGGNQVWLRGFDWVWSAKQERQADEFAAWLTIPDGEEPYIAGLSTCDVAKIYKVAEDLAGVRRGT